MNGPALRGRRPSGDRRLKIPLSLFNVRTPRAHIHDTARALARRRANPKGEVMRVLKLFIVAAFAVALLVSLTRPTEGSGQSGPTEAPAAFDNQTNGFEP